MISFPNCLPRPLGVALAIFSACLPSLHAGENDSPAESSSVSDWWNGKSMTGQWFGMRDFLDDKGLTLYGSYSGALFGVVDSQGGSRGVWDQQLQFGGEQNFGKLLQIESLEGVKGFASFRWRDPSDTANPGPIVESSTMFNPSNWNSGLQFRVLSFGMEIGSGNNFPVKDMIVLRGGWLQPQGEFLIQPLSKLFLNNAVNSSKGVGGNIPFSSSYSTWGGTLNVKPLDWYYAKAGLFMAFPQATASSNHGIAYEGFAQDPSQNGLLAMGETGITPKIGPQKLPGKYALGGYYFGQQKNSFNGTYQYGQYGFYGQADQMIFREPSPEPSTSSAKNPPDGKSHVTGKDFKSPMSLEAPKLGNQGLSLFSLVSFAPKYNNLFPFYFQTGLVYQGLIPTRDKDLTMFVLAYGNYSYYNTLAQRSQGSSNQPNYTIFLEWAYRIQLNPWAFVQPFAQYVIRPNGTGDVQNATILGFSTGVTF